MPYIADRTKFGSDQYDISGWTIQTQTTPISCDSDVEELKHNLAAPNMPEQLFGSSFLRVIHHRSGCVLEFNAADALRQWHKDDEPPVQVASATQWQASRQDTVSKVAALQYDWTYSTSYAGTVRRLTPKESDGSHFESPGMASSQPQPQQSSCCNNSQTSVAEVGATDSSIPTWQPSNDQLGMALLRARDPIQFYAEVPLYESELDDNGSSQLSVKVRVMPSCWFVLLRFFLRIDGTLVRLREARLFCDLKQPDKVVREVRRSEATLSQLSGNAAGNLGGAHADAESAAVALSAIAPNGVQAYQVDTLSLVPISQ